VRRVALSAAEGVDPYLGVWFEYGSSTAVSVVGCGYFVISMVSYSQLRGFIGLVPYMSAAISVLEYGLSSFFRAWVCQKLSSLLSNLSSVRVVIGRSG